MMIKVNDDYLDFNDDIIIEKQIFNYATLETAGTFSYSFKVTDSAKNRKILGIPDVSSNTIISLVENVKMYTDSGTMLYIGYILIEDQIGIDCSFFSDNNNFFASITGNVSDVDGLDQYNVLINEANIVASWSADSGIVFPLVDRGGAYLRKDPFMKLRIRNGRTDQNDWQPFIFVKDVLREVLQKFNLKIDGDLVKDATFAKLITTNSSLEVSRRIIERQNFYVGTETAQTIPNGVANAIKVNFDLIDVSPFFNSELGSFDDTLNRFNLTYDSVYRLSVAGVVSDDTHEIHWEFRINGAGSGIAVFTRSTSVDFNSDTTFKLYESAGDYIELWAYVDAGTPGTVDIVSLSLRSDVKRSNMVFAKALIPSMTCRKFIGDLFQMFNVVADFDPYTRTINTRLFKNIIQQPAVNLSQYVHRVASLKNLELISDYAQSNILAYSELGDAVPIVEYNQANEIPFAAGEIDVDNRSLDDQKTIVELKFKAPFVYRHEGFGLYLIRLDFIEYASPTSDDGSLNGREAVTSVTDNAGLARFNTASTNYTLAENNFIDDAQGFIDSIGGGIDGFDDQNSQYKELEGDNQIIAIFLKDVSLPNTFRFTEFSDAVTANWPIVRVSDMTTPAYNGDWEHSLLPSVPRSSAGVAVFARAQDGTELDVVRQGLSFGDIQGMNSLTLKDTYYSGLEAILNDPVKPFVEMIMPENVYLNLRFTDPVRIETERLNGVFIVNKCTGYKDSHTPCTLELLKLSV